MKSKIKANVLILFHFQDQVIEALRRSKFKFPGRQKIFVSKNWGFTKWNREQYAEMKADGRLKHDGVNVKYVSIFNVCIIYYYILLLSGISQNTVLSRLGARPRPTWLELIVRTPSSIVCSDSR